MPKIVDHQALRLSLLEKITPLFLHYGYEGLTTRQLAVHLGISTGKLYHYFASKEAIFEAMALHWMEKDMSWVRECFAGISGQAERIRSVAYFLSEHRSKFDTQNQMVLRFCQLQQQRGVDMLPFWEGLYAAWGKLTREMLDLQSQFAVELMCQVLDGVFLQWIQGGKNTDLVVLFERLAYWLPIIDAQETSGDWSTGALDRESHPDRGPRVRPESGHRPVPD